MKDKDLLADAVKLKQEINPYHRRGDAEGARGRLRHAQGAGRAAHRGEPRSKPDLKVLEGQKKGEKKK